MATKKSAALLVRQRDSHCPHCGQSENLVVHHRRNRQMGGSKILDRPDNLLLICAAWNVEIESNANAANQAREWGHKLGSWNGFDTPVFDKIKMEWFTIDEKGGKTVTEPPSYLI